MNTVNLIGRLAKDPDIRTFDKGKDGEVVQATFTLAVDRGNDEADFIRCVAYGKIAELIEEFIAKGMRVGVTGHIRTGSYEHKDGYTVWTFDIIVDRFDFADAKRETDDDRGSRKAGKRGKR